MLQIAQYVLLAQYCKIILYYYYLLNLTYKTVNFLKGAWVISQGFILSHLYTVCKFEIKILIAAFLNLFFKITTISWIEEI